MGSPNLFEAETAGISFPREEHNAPWKGGNNNHVSQTEEARKPEM